MSLPFIYKPRPGEEISVSRDADGRCAIVVTSGTRTASARILAGEASGFAVEAARAICEAAGKPEPVILERPRPRDLLVPGAGDGESWVDVTPSRIRDGGVTLALRAWSNDNGGYGSVRLVGDEPLRVAVALADAMRDVQDEPDPAEVGELAALMDAEMDRRASGQSGLYPAVARIALQWMNGRQQREGEQPR